jgi:hypothetical protein
VFPAGTFCPVLFKKPQWGSGKSHDTEEGMVNVNEEVL